jgi:hypothetical protein
LSYWTPDQVDQILAEHDDDGDPVRAAIFLEAAFGIQLSDAEMLDPETRLRTLVLAKLELA